MSNTSHLSQKSSIRSPHNSSEVAGLGDPDREQRELRHLVSRFKWENNSKLIDEESDDLDFLNNQVQMQNQEIFSNKFIKNLNLRRSNSSGEQSTTDYKTVQQTGFLQESPQILDDDDEDEDEVSDPDYINEKVTEKSLNSDDEYLEEEYNSDFDEEEDAKLRTQLRSKHRKAFTEFEVLLEETVKSRLFRWCMTFLVSIILLLFFAAVIVNSNNGKLYEPTTRRYTQYIPVDSLSEVNSKLKHFQNNLDDLFSKLSFYNTEHEKITLALQRTQQSFNHRLDDLNRNYQNVEERFHHGLLENDSVTKEFKLINTKLKSYEELLKRGRAVDVDHTKHLNDIFEQVSIFESALETTNKKVDDLMEFKSKIEQVFSTLKENVLQSVIEKLPSLIPMSLTQDNEIRMFPEVYDYLSEVIRQTVNSQLNSIDLKNVENQTQMTWENFLQQNGIELNQYLTQFVTDELKLVKKLDFEQILVENFKANRDKLDKELFKIKKSIDQNVNLLESKISRLQHTSSDLIESNDASQLFIDHLIERKIDENKLRIEGRANYADADQGLSVVKNLTSKSIRNHLRKRKSIVSRALFGWYDFLRRVIFGTNSFNTALIDNPTNVLLENKAYWVSLVNNTHLGIKLSKDILLLDVLFVHPRNDNTLILTSAPRKISIYVKPVSRKDQDLLKEKFSKRYDQDFVSGLSQFSKITEFEYDINNAHINQYAPIPKEFSRLNIPIKEVYIEVETNWGHDQITSLHNIKVFGINNNDLTSAKKLLQLSESASTEEVMEHLRHKFVDRATYALHSDDEFNDLGELGIEL